MELDYIFYIYIGKFISNLNINYLFDFESYKKIIVKESICIQFYIECFIMFLSLFLVKVLIIMDKINYIFYLLQEIKKKFLWLKGVM